MVLTLLSALSSSLIAPHLPQQRHVPPPGAARMTADSPDAAASDAERSARVSLAAVAAVGCAETGAITADKLWGGGALGAMWR